MRDRFFRFVSVLMVIATAVVLPFGFDGGGYTSISNVKESIVFFILVALASILVSLLVVRLRKGKAGLKIAEFGLLDSAVLFFMLVSLLSCVLSKMPFVSFRDMLQFGGTMTYLCGGLLYFQVSRHYNFPKWLEYVVVASWGVLFVWGIFNAMGVRFLLPLSPDLHPYEAISTLGHFNAASAFYCLSVSFVSCMFIRGGSWLENVLYGMCCFAGFLASLLLSTDGLWYGVLPALALLFLYSGEDFDRVRRMGVLLFLFALSLCLFRLMLSGSLLQRNECESVFLAEHYAGEILFVCALAIFLLLRRGISYNVRAGISKLCAISLAVIFVVVLAVTFYRGWIDPHFATNRGAIWKGGVWTFRTYSPGEKLWGMGCFSFSEKLSLAANMLLGRHQYNTIYLTAHDSLLQVLLAQGLLGLAAYLAGICGLILSAVKCWKRRTDAHYFVFLIPIVSYLGQSLVTSPYTVNLPILFLMLGLYRGGLSKEVK